MIKKSFVLFIAICLQSLVKAEVVELTHYDNPHNHYTIQNQEGFTALLGDIHYWNSPNFSDYVNELLPHGQMPGFSAFLPVDGVEPVRVFAAKKQNPEHPIPPYNFLNILHAEQDHVPNLNDFHTERQLVSRILGNLPLDIQGNFLIFTRSQPCPIGGNDNGNNSCYEFYLDLANYFQNINIHIYIDRFDINPDRVVPSQQYGNHKDQNYVQRFEQIMELVLGHIQAGAEHEIPNVQIHEGQLMVHLANEQWRNVNQDSDFSIKRKFIARVNSALNQHQDDWREFKENIVNGHYSGNGDHNRINYHVR